MVAECLNIWQKEGEAMQTTDAGQKEMPLVSVIMPAYNSEIYIESAIRSVQAQTVDNWELLVLEDGSKDSTPEIVAKLAAEDERIRLLPNEENMGPARTRNRGMDLCTGKYIAFLDSDDIWYPDKLEKQLALAEEYEADIMYCSYAIVDSQGKSRSADFIVPPQADLKYMLVKSVFSCSTAMLRRSSVGDSRFPVDFYHEDYAFWLALLQKGLVARGTPEVLAAYRVSENSRASNKLASAVRRWHVYRKFLHYSFFRSAWYLSRYAFAGVLKYRKKQ